MLLLLESQGRTCLAWVAIGKELVAKNVKSCIIGTRVLVIEPWVSTAASLAKWLGGVLEDRLGTLGAACGRATRSYLCQCAFGDRLIGGKGGRCDGWAVW